MKIERLFIGLICIAVSIWMFLSGELSENPAPATAVLVIGIIAVATSRWKK